jgi:AcrR family transcriptional regulator
MSLGVISDTLGTMPRWEPDARARLHDAALALYDERGFDETTVAEIADRAGLTKRTFFRYFADKREVLFSGGENIEEHFVARVQAAPAAAPALHAVALGLDAIATAFDEQGELAARRFRIVRASPELWERQLIKFASLAEAVAKALRARGVADPAAILAAEAGITALRVSSGRWLEDTNEKPLRQLVAEALEQLRAVACAEMAVEVRRKD